MNAPENLRHVPQDFVDLGIHCPERAVLYLPRTYIDNSVVHDLLFLTDEPVLFRLTLSRRPQIDFKSKPRRIKLHFIDSGNKEVSLMAFGDLWTWKSLAPGQQYVIRAACTLYERFWNLKNATLVHSSQQGRVVPVYPKEKPGLGGYIQSAVHIHASDAAKYASAVLDGMSESAILHESKNTEYSSLADLFRQVHTPSSLVEAQKSLQACGRIAAYEIARTANKQAVRKPNHQSIINIKSDDIELLRFLLPYEMTNDQFNAVADIMRDLAEPYPSRRLISGDVGVGKSLPLQVVAIAAQMVGAHVAILVINELVAKQLHDEILQFWRFAKVQLITKETKISSIDVEENPVWIGTTAMFSRATKLDWHADLLIVDEQHKLAQAQRERMADNHTNLVEATATCVPRTMGLISFHGMNVSVIKESPVEKQIHSKIYLYDDRRYAASQIKSILNSGGQVAIVYPRIDASEDEEKAAYEKAIVNWEDKFPGQVIGINGRMSPQEKQSAVDALKAGQYQILVSTVAIEVGITLPSLMGLAVVEADMMGVAQLHQLRGRVARKGGTGWFGMLPSEHVGEDAMTRLRLVEKINDGFALAEEDMKIRGFGDLAEDSNAQWGKACSDIFGISLLPEQVAYLLS